MKKVLIAVVVVAVLAGVAYKVRLVPVTGKVTFVEGAAVAVIDGREQPVAVGMDIPPGTTIRTQAGAQVDVRLKDQVAVRVQENGEATVSQNARNRYSNDYAVGLDLKQGELLNRVDALPPGSDYTVRTSNAVCGVRGTRFGVTASADATEVGVMDGSVTIKFGDQERTLSANEICNIYRGREGSDVKQLTERQRQRLKPCGLLNFTEVVQATRAMVDIANGATIKQDIDVYYLNNGRYPATLRELYGSDKIDQFGHPFIYIVEGNKYKLASIGEDNVPGSGDDVIYTQ